MGKRIVIRMEVNDEYSDDKDPTGVTDETSANITNDLLSYGDDIEIQADN